MRPLSTSTSVSSRASRAEQQRQQRSAPSVDQRLHARVLGSEARRGGPAAARGLRRARSAASGVGWCSRRYRASRAFFAIVNGAIELRSGWRTVPAYTLTIVRGRPLLAGLASLLRLARAPQASRRAHARGHSPARAPRAHALQFNPRGELPAIRVESVPAGAVPAGGVGAEGAPHALELPLAIATRTGFTRSSSGSSRSTSR